MKTTEPTRGPKATIGIFRNIVEDLKKLFAEVALLKIRQRHGAQAGTKIAIVATVYNTQTEEIIAGIVSANGTLVSTYSEP